MTEILTPESPRWKTFTKALELALQINGCDSHGHRLAKPILSIMEGVNIPETIKFFEAHGGYCDCEILMNVEPW